MLKFENLDEIRNHKWSRNSTKKNREAFESVERFILANKNDRKTCMEAANIAIHHGDTIEEPLTDEEYDQMLDEIEAQFAQ